MPRLERLERWSDRESNGGTRLDFCVPDDVLKAEVYLEVGTREELDLAVDPDHPWASSLVERNVVRTVFVDDAGTKTYDEWRVWIRKATRRKTTGRRREFVCRSIKFDLSDELVVFPQADGTGFLHHELADLEVDDFIDAIMALSTWPADFTKGTIEPTTRHTWIVDWEPYLAALVEAATVTGAELDVRRDGVNGYVVDLLDEVRSGQRTEVRFSANAIEADTEHDWTEAGTLIYPKGEGPQGAAPSVGDMRWHVEPQPGESSPTTLWRLHPFDGTARASGWLSLRPGFNGIVCTEADQFNGFYIAGVQITDSAPANNGRAIDVTLASSITTPVGPTWMRVNADGDELLYVPVPSKIATHGRRAMVLARDDIPGITNLVSLPFELGKEGVHWIPWGSPTVSTVGLLASPFVHFGDTSSKVVADADQGVSKYANRLAGRDSWMVSPSRPHLSFQVYGHLESGSVRFEVFFVFVSPISDAPDIGTIYRFPTGDDSNGDPIEARAVATGGAPFHMTIEPATFNFSFSEGQVAQVGYITNLELRVTAREPGTVFYLDAFQVVNHPTAADKIVAGSSTFRLWDAACRAIQKGAADPEVRLRTTALDFNRLGRDPLFDVAYEYGEVAPGVTARIVDPGIGLEEERRIRSVRRDLKREALTAIELMEAESVA